MLKIARKTLRVYHRNRNSVLVCIRHFEERGISFAKKIIEKSNEIAGSGGWRTILEERLINVPLVERWVCNGPQRGWARAS